MQLLSSQQVLWGGGSNIALERLGQTDTVRIHHVEKLTPQIVFLQEAFTVSGLVHAAPVFTTVP